MKDKIIILYKMNFGKHTWVCSICGQGLTRKSTAIRHNNNLHFGGAMLVRPYEYIVGRINGKFFESDPSLYKRNKKDLKKGSTSIYDSHNRINNLSEFEAAPDSIVHESSYGNVAQQKPIEYGNIEWPIYHQHNPNTTLQQSNKPINPHNSSERMLGTMSKLEQLGILLRKYYPPEIASGILRFASCNSEFLDRNLSMFLDLDRRRPGFY
jgi:hypothetical protein